MCHGARRSAINAVEESRRMRLDTALARVWYAQRLADTPRASREAMTGEIESIFERRERPAQVGDVDRFSRRNKRTSAVAPSFGISVDF